MPEKTLNCLRSMHPKAAERTGQSFQSTWTISAGKLFMSGNAGHYNRDIPDFYALLVLDQILGSSPDSRRGIRADSHAR